MFLSPLPLPCLFQTTYFISPLWAWKPSEWKMSQGFGNTLVPVNEYGSCFENLFCLWASQVAKAACRQGETREAANDSPPLGCQTTVSPVRDVPPPRLSERAGLIATEQKATMREKRVTWCRRHVLELKTAQVVDSDLTQIKSNKNWVQVWVSTVNPCLSQGIPSRPTNNRWKAAI